MKELFARIWPSLSTLEEFCAQVEEPVDLDPGNDDGNDTGDDDGDNPTPVIIAHIMLVLGVLAVAVYLN